MPAALQVTAVSQLEVGVGHWSVAEVEQLAHGLLLLRIELCLYPSLLTDVPEPVRTLLRDLQGLSQVATLRHVQQVLLLVVA